LGNFNTVLHDGLESEGPDVVQTFSSILFLNQFYCRIHNTYSPLLLQLSWKMLHWKSNPNFGEYIIEIVDTAEYNSHLDFSSYITLGTLHFKSKDSLGQGKIPSLLLCSLS
jgi:hypothetical protein